ncbi:MAG: hypothetical protein ACLFV7_03465 [Phycisphaerae bacterium]
MRNRSPDRYLAVAVSTSLVVWCACLVFVWMLLLDTSLLTHLLGVGVLLGCFGGFASMPGRVARGTQALLVKLRVVDPQTLELHQANAGAPADDTRARRRLPAGGGLIAVGCGIASTVMLALAAGWVGSATVHHLWSPGAWAVMKLLLLTAGLAPIALGMGLWTLTCSIARRRGGQEVCALELRDWMEAVAAGLALLAGAIYVGLNLLGLLVVAAVVAIGAAVGLFVWPLRAGESSAPRPLEIPSLRQRLAIAGTAAWVSLALLVQLRMLVDLGGFSLAGRCAWTAGSFALLAVFAARRDQPKRPPSAARSVGCVIGAVSGLFLQASLLLTGGRSGAGVVLIALAIATQVPLCAMTATVLSRGRRVFGASGGRARELLTLLGLGSAGGVAVFVAASSYPRGGVALLGVGLATLAGALLANIRASQDPREQVGWSLLGAGVLATVTVAVVVPVGAWRRQLPRARVGAWLTVWEDQRSGVLPVPAPGRSAAVDAFEYKWLADAKGLWAAVAPAAVDVPTELTGSVYHPADAVAAGNTGWGLPARGRSWRSRFDGVYYAPLRADHPRAWRAYSAGTLAMLGDRVHAGPVVVRTRARGDAHAALAAVAVTYLRSVGDGWAVLDLGNERAVEMMIVGPAGVVNEPDAPEELTVVKLSRIAEMVPFLRPTGPLRPGGLARMKVDLKKLSRLFDTPEPAPLNPF